MAQDLSDIALPDYDLIKSWKSILTLIVFVLANIVVLFPFHVPLYIPRFLHYAILDSLSFLHILPPRDRSRHVRNGSRGPGEPPSTFVCFQFPLNFVTAPLIGDLFLLATVSIGRTEVSQGTWGVANISPLDIMLFFISLAYIAISIDASGIIRFLAFKVLQWGGDVGHRLFFFLYIFWFALTSFVGNDPVILSGTAFLAYMTRVSSNIVHPRAWIFTQFAAANIGSAILVSSNPTNLVLAGAFDIKFIEYTANMIVPVIFTGIVLFPFLLYIVFNSEALIPRHIKLHELPPEVRQRKPVNPNIPHARGTAEQQEDAAGEEGKLLSLEEIVNPFLDRKGAAFGAIIMALTLIAVLAVNASTAGTNTRPPVFYVTLPAAVIMFTWDLITGWLNRHETRKIAREGREQIERMRLQQELGEQEGVKDSTAEEGERSASSDESASARTARAGAGGVLTAEKPIAEDDEISKLGHTPEKTPTREVAPLGNGNAGEKTPTQHVGQPESTGEKTPRAETPGSPQLSLPPQRREPTTLVSITIHSFRWLQETFPTAMAVISHLPFALIPFAFSMFVLVQSLVTKGWVPIFAVGWDAWVNKTGTIGAIGGMGFLSVCLCNFSGTNIGTTILLSRVVQCWEKIHQDNHTPISNRTFWATVYTMALGVNFGAFSTAFSASLAGLLWRDILSKKHIHVRRLDFARVNLPIIVIAMTVGCVVLIGEVWIRRDDSPISL